MSEQRRRLPPAQAKVAGTRVGPGIQGKLGAWLMNHGAVASSSLRGLFNALVSSLMTWLVIGIALALPTILYLLLLNVGELTSDWEGRPRISVYLDDGLTVAEGEKIADRFAGLTSVESTHFISAEAALAEFTALSGFGDVLSALDRNPLPSVVEVVPGVTQQAELRLLVERLESEPSVVSVSVDLEWIERLFAILSLGQRFVAALGFFLGLGVLLSIGNTIRLAIENRRSEIEVVKLVGGTDSFVRRPFLYLGFWYGLGGSLIAWLMVQASLLFLSGPVDRLVQSYHDQFALAGMGVGASLVLLLVGGALGIAGASLAVSRHLHEIEPR